MNPTLPAAHPKTRERAIELFISHYRVIERIGGGGMGQVYKAEDLRLHRFVALKFSDDTFGHRPSLKLVQQEAQAASALNHPNICTVYDLGEENGQVFIAMEFLEGSTLQQRITDGTLPLDLTLDLAIQIADGLGSSAPQGHHPPRHQAGKHFRNPAPPGQAAGLRSRRVDQRHACSDIGRRRLTGVDCTPRPTHRGRRATSGHRRLYVARAGQGRSAGSIASLGSQYVLELRAMDCQSGDMLAQEQATAAAKENVLDALGKAASKLRGELGESLVTVQKFDVPLPEATTSSLEALRAYSLGNQAFALSDSSAALPYHQRAIELDPNFARGYAAVGFDYNAMGQLGRAREYFTKAFQLRNHASDRERLAITADYYFNVTGELDKAAQTAEETIQSYPSSFGTYLVLGAVYENQGRFEQAAELYRQYLRVYPDDVGAYGDLVNSLLALQRFDKAEQTIRQIQARKPDDLVLHNAVYALAFLRNDSPAMTQQQHWFVGKPEQNVGLALASDTEAYAGHLGKARELTKQAVDSAIRVDSKETAAMWQQIAAQREAAFGNTSEGKQEVAQGLKLYPDSQGVEAEAALGFALAGDVAQADSLAQDLGVTEGRRDVSPEMQQKVIALTASGSTTLDKIKLIAQFVQHDIRYVAIELGIGGYQPHPAAEIFTHRYGDCKDKATLMSAMLHALGVDSYYVLINVERGVVTPEMPAHNGFDHVILAIRLPDAVKDSSLMATATPPQLGRILFFDPTNEFVPFGHIGGYLQANYGLLVTPSGGELIQLPQEPPGANGVQRSGKLVMDASGSLRGDVREVRVGDAAFFQRDVQHASANASDQLHPIEVELAASIPDYHILKAQVINLQHIEQSFGYDYSFEAGHYAKPAGNMLLLRPRVLGIETSGLLETQEPRRFPIEFEALRRDTDVFDITLPAGFQVDELPEAIDLDLDFVSYHSKSEVAGDTIRYSRSFELKQLTVPVTQADQLKKVYRIIAADERGMAVLKPK